MDYYNFDLRLGEWNPTSRTGVAEVLYSPAGEGKRYSFLLDIDLASCAGRVHRTHSMAVELGRKLAESIFSQECVLLWQTSYHIARERGRGLRLRLHIDSWELRRLPWEMLYDTHRGEFLVFDPMVSLVRYIRLHAAPPSLHQSESFKVLVIIASPTDQAKLDCEGELRVLQDALGELIAAGHVEIIPCIHATHEKLHIALLENTPDVVHFIGHGEYDQEQRAGFLMLEDERGHSAPLGASEAARMLRRYGTNLVILNACETANGAWAGLAPALVRAEIAAVVAMQWPVEDQAAIRFSRAFYTALSLGQTIDECVAEGRVGASAASPDPNDWAAPVLFLRSLSGQLWTSDMAGSHEPPQSAPQPGDILRSPMATPNAPTSHEGGFYFKTRGPLLFATDAELIINRPELRRAIRIAQQPSVTQYIAFLSARQTGKTTLLFRLRDLLRDYYACIFIDLSVLSAQNASACFRFVAFRLITEFRAILGASFPLPETRRIASAVEFLAFLSELADIVPMPRIILLVDEVGALSPQVSNSFFNTLRTVFTQGRGLTNHLAKYLFVFSGAVDLYALTSDSNSPLNICEKIYLRDFDLPDVVKIVGQFSKLDMKLSEGAPAKIYELTGGHPYLTLQLCALMERAQIREVTPAEIERTAEKMLVEDDNIRHVIRELERRPLERRRLRSILFEGRKVPFSRNDPVLASLEMIGAIRAVQPCEVRNRLYERTLQQYYAQLDSSALEQEAAVKPLLPFEAKQPEDIEAMYTRLLALRAEALDDGGLYKEGKACENFAAALFSMVPAFSIYSDVPADARRLNVVLAINADAPGASYWNAYQPAILVECQDLDDASSESNISEIVDSASLHNIKLVFIMTSGETTSDATPQARYSGAHGDIYVVFIDDTEIAQLLKEHKDLDTFLRNKVLDARLLNTGADN